MATLMIAYDLNRGGDYHALIERIKTLGAWWHNLDSLWLVKTGKSASEVRDLLKAHLDANDELLVIDVSGRARAWKGFSESGSKWLKETFD